MPEGKTKPRLASIEDVVSALAAECDGAKTRDGRGFNRPDANEGGRLAALTRSGFGWSVADATKAADIVRRYARQAGLMLGRGREAKVAGIERSIREGYIRTAEPPVKNQKTYSYASASSGGKHAYVWRMSDVDSVALAAGLAEICRGRHGNRRISMTTTRNAEMTVNGERKSFDRIEIDLNETTRNPFVSLCEELGILIEPALLIPCDPDVDEIRKNLLSVWIHRGTRDGEKGEWAVFDLAAKNERFSKAVKQHLPGHYKCEPSDDWNWYIRMAPETSEVIRKLAEHFGFSSTAEFDRETRPVVRPFLLLDD